MPWIKKGKKKTTHTSIAQTYAYMHELKMNENGNDEMISNSGWSHWKISWAISPLHLTTEAFKYLLLNKSRRKTILT